MSDAVGHRSRRRRLQRQMPMTIFFHRINGEQDNFQGSFQYRELRSSLHFLHFFRIGRIREWKFISVTSITSSGFRRSSKANFTVFAIVYEYIMNESIESFELESLFLPMIFLRRFSLKCVQQVHRERPFEWRPRTDRDVCGPIGFSREEPKF